MCYTVYEIRKGVLLKREIFEGAEIENGCVKSEKHGTGAIPDVR